MVLYLTRVLLLDIVVSSFFNDTATTEIYTHCHTLARHDALPISAPTSSASPTRPSGMPRSAYFSTEASSPNDRVLEKLRIRPGATQLTLTPWPAYAAARLIAMPVRPALDAA